MRVLVITNMYPPHHYGGYELSCADTVRFFADRGHEVSVLTSTIRVAGIGPGPAEPETRVWRDLRMYWSDHTLLSPRLTTRLRMERHNQRALERALQESDPEVVSVWNMGALSLGLLSTLRARCLPTVLVVADPWPAYAPRLDAWSRLFAGPVGRIAGHVVAAVTGLATTAADYGGTATCLFNSEAMRRVAHEHSTWTFGREAVEYPGVNTADFPVAAPATPPSPRPWRGELLYVGRLDARKGVHTVIDAVAQLPESRLYLVGRGDAAYERELHSRVEALGLGERVRFAVLERADLREVYADADALIFPSWYEEPFGIVPLEAMACDTPVVATGQGGSGEYLRDAENCLLFPPDDPAALAAAVARLASDPALRLRLVDGGRRMAGRLTSDRYAAALLEWHRAAASGFSQDTEPGPGRPSVTDGAGESAG